MAIGTPTLVTDEVNTANTQIWNASNLWTPVVGEIYAIVQRATRGSSTMSGAQGVTHTGFAGGFNLITSLITEEGSNRQELTFYWGIATSATNAGLVLDSGESANTQSQQYAVVTATGIHKTTPVPSGQFEEATENNTADGTVSVALPSAPAASSFTLSALAIGNDATTDPTIPSGWSGLSNLTNTAPVGRLVVAYKLPGEQTAAWTGALSAGTADLAAITVEFQEAVAALGEDPEAYWLRAARDPRTVTVFA